MKTTASRSDESFVLIEKKNGQRYFLRLEYRERRRRRRMHLIYGGCIDQVFYDHAQTSGNNQPGLLRRRRWFWVFFSQKTFRFPGLVLLADAGRDRYFSFSFFNLRQTRRVFTAGYVSQFNGGFERVLTWKLSFLSLLRWRGELWICAAWIEVKKSKAVLEKQPYQLPPIRLPWCETE